MSCPFCDLEFKQGRSDQQHCSRNCKDRAYQTANRERINQASREYYQNNKEKIISQQKVYKAANIEQTRKRGVRGTRNYRARKRKVLTIPFTEAQLADRLSMSFGCWLCGGPAQTVDHVKPISAGGPHILANLRPACGACNRSKSGKWPL